MLQTSFEEIPSFSGRDGTYPITRWIGDIEANSEIFGWTPLQQLLVARRSLTGTAALWLKAERPYRSWNDLKTALKEEFSDDINMKTIHEMMSSRKKLPTETCVDYMFVMKELGRRGNMPDDVTIKYIIDGIHDQESNKIMLYGVSSYPEFKERLKIYETIKKKEVRQKCSEIFSPSVPSVVKQERKCVQCFACGEEGHPSSECPNREKGSKCFQCNDFGHIASECACVKKKPVTMSNDRKCPEKHALLATEVDPGQRQDDTNEKDDTKDAERVLVTHINSTKTNKIGNDNDNYFDVWYVNKQPEYHDDRKPTKMMKFNKNIFTKGLVDSGSDMNLISTDFYNKIGSPKCSLKGNLNLTGLGRVKVSAVGKFATNIEIDDCTYNDVVFNIVPSEYVPIQVVLGHSFLKNVLLIMKDGTVWLIPNDWLCEVKYFNCSFDSVGYIQEAIVRKKVKRKEYKLAKVKMKSFESDKRLEDEFMYPTPIT